MTAFNPNYDLDSYLEEMSKDARSVLLYAETCAVDHGGLLEGVRMNEADMKALRKMESDRLLRYGRIPARLLGQFPGQRKPTHWVKFYDFAWEVAHELRREFRARQLGPYATAVFDALEEDGKL